MASSAVIAIAKLYLVKLDKFEIGEIDREE